MAASPASAVKECPSCKRNALDLLKIDTGMKLALEHIEYDGAIPSAVCSNCYQDFTSKISNGAKLRAQKIAKDENKKIIWRQRLELAQKGRENMAIKNYPNAAMFYEKYLYGLATGFDIEPQNLVPSLFVDVKYKKELIVVCYAYFDLFKIYDHSSNPATKEKYNLAKEQLKLFANLPSTRPLILRKLRNYKASANNKGAVDEVLKALDKNKDGRCFIATAAFGSSSAPEVQTFYVFRDEILARWQLGQLLVQWYYFLSPPLAKILDRSSLAKKMARFILRVVAVVLRSIFNLKSLS